MDLGLESCEIGRRWGHDFFSPASLRRALSDFSVTVIMRDGRRQLRYIGEHQLRHIRINRRTVDDLARYVCAVCSGRLSW